MKAILDTTMKGCDVDPSLLLVCDGNESTTVNGSTDEHDGDRATPTERSLYTLISESNVEVCWGRYPTIIG